MFANRALRARVSASKPLARASRASRTRRTSAVVVVAASNGDDGDEDATLERRRRALDARTMDAMLGKTTESVNDCSHAERPRRAVVRARAVGVAGACVVAGALGGGWTSVRKPPTPAPAHASASASFEDRLNNARSNGMYVAQRVFGWPLYGKVFMITAAMVPLVLAAAAVYRHVSEEEWGASIAKTFYWLNDVPGADSTAEENWKSVVVAQLIVFCGMFTFAILIGVVSDEIASKVDEVKTGNSKVFEQNHTVILNWNEQLIPLLKQVAVAKSEGIGFERPVVLLANREKEEMDATIEDELQDSPPLTVVTRSGQAHNAEDLDRVNAWAAERVVVLHDDGENEDTVESQKAAAVLNLRSGGGITGGRGPNVIVQSPTRRSEIDDGVALAVDLTEKEGNKHGEFCVVNGTGELSKLKAYSIMQPGGSKLFEDLMLQSDDSSEFYTYSHPSLAGKTFQEAWRMFNTTTLVGITNAEGMILGPSETDVIGPSGAVTVVADNKSTIEADIAKRKGSNKNENIPPPGSQHLTMLRCPVRMPAPRKVVMLGWNEESSSVLEDMLVLAPPGSSITLINNYELDKSILKGNTNCNVKHVAMDAQKRATLEQNRVHEAGAVLIMPPTDSDDATQDSHALSSIMQVAYLSKRADTGHAPHIVSELSSEVAKRVAEDMYAGIGTVDVILHDNLIGGALLQVSANTKLAGLFDYLLEKQGKELYMRMYNEFVTENDAEVYWGTICERARERDEIALGIMRADGELAISPRKDKRVRLNPGDQVVVLAEDWWTPTSVKAKQS